MTPQWRRGWPRPSRRQASRLAPSVADLSLNPERAALGAMKALAKSWQAYRDEPRFWKRAWTTAIS